MPSLRQLLAGYAPILVLDTSSAAVQVGWLDSLDDSRWFTLLEESGTGLFQCLQQSQRSVREAAAFVYCDGPGSMLGVRTAAMAIRAWQVVQQRPVYAFHSLVAVAHGLGRSEVTVISDARRESWHTAKMNTPLGRAKSSELSGVIVMPEGFRNWTVVPPDVERVPYSLSEIFPQIPDTDLFRISDAPDAFTHEETRYATWTPQIHRAP